MRQARRDAVSHPEFLEDLRYFVRTERRVAPRALDMIDAVIQDPFSGIGKPEPLKHQLAGAWARRLTKVHRIIYLVREDRIEFLQARYHYE